MSHSPLSLINLIVVVAICAVTASLSGWRERIAAGAILLAVLASTVVQQASAAAYPALPLMAVDGVLLAVLMGVAWRARRVWTICAVGLQGLVLAVDGLRAVETDMDVHTYRAALSLCTYGLAGVIAYAGWAAWRRGSTA